MPPKRKAKPPAKTDDDDDEQVVFSNLKVGELKDECVQRGLDPKGRKSDLVER